MENIQAIISKYVTPVFFDKCLKALRRVVVLEGWIFAGTSLYWWFFALHNPQEYSDSLFITSFGCLCIGGLIVIASTSRRSYYRYIRAKSQGKPDCEKHYELDIKNQRRNSIFGVLLGCAGFIGMALSAPTFNLAL